jgi:integrase
MSIFASHLEDYLCLRRGLGHQLETPARLLPRFVAYLDTIGESTITVENALAWVTEPEAGPASFVWVHRMGAVRGFARYMSGIDASNQIPPLGLVSARRVWRPPFIYSEADVVALINEIPRVVPTPFRAATFATIIGLLAATGMRVGEVIALTRADVDWDEGVLTVRNTKFDKSREVALHPSTVTAMADYARLRDRSVPKVTSPRFFLSSKGTPVIYVSLREKFRQVVVATGVGANAAHPPRMHDFRHGFAVNTLIRWHREGQDVGRLLPRLSTYLGHLSPTKGSQTVFVRHGGVRGVVFV